MRAALLIAATLSVAGCMGMEAVRDAEPLASAEFDGDYREMTDCVADRLLGRREVIARTHASQPVSTITPILGATAPVGAWELRIVGVGEHRTFAELRSDRSALGTPYGDDAWKAVEACAGA